MTNKSMVESAQAETFKETTGLKGTELNSNQLQ